MRVDEIRKLKSKELETKVTDLKEEIFKLRFRATTEPLSDPARVREIRRDIARLKTVLKARALGREHEPGEAAAAAAEAK